MEKNRRYFNSGTCRTLKENAYLLVIFVDDDESSWNEKDMMSYWNNHVILSTNFIMNQAKKYGIDLKIELGCYYTNEQLTIKYDGIINKDLMSKEISKDLMDQTVKCLKAKSKKTLHKFVQDTAKYEQIIYAIAVNKDGRSYSVPDYCATDEEHLEYCVVFPRYLGKKRNIKTYSLAHEILHLFGAEDYYNPYKKYPNRKKLAGKLCPNDIMLKLNSELHLNVIDKYTAYSIGWLDELPIEYDNEDWWK